MGENDGTEKIYYLFKSTQSKFNDMLIWFHVTILPIDSCPKLVPLIRQFQPPHFPFLWDHVLWLFIIITVPEMGNPLLANFVMGNSQKSPTVIYYCLARFAPREREFFFPARNLYYWKIQSPFIHRKKFISDSPEVYCAISDTTRHVGHNATILVLLHVFFSYDSSKFSDCSKSRRLGHAFCRA